MKNKFISMLLAAALTTVSFTAPVFAEDVRVDEKFNAQLSEAELKNWQFPETYYIDHTGIHNMVTQSQVIYTGQTFSGKYEVSMDFRMGFLDSNKFLFNYVDKNNYQSVELVPDYQQVIIRTVRDGNVYANAIEDIEIVLKATQWYTMRIVSNGGEGVSVYMSYGGLDYTLIEDVYAEGAVGTGFVGYNSCDNPLELKNFRVVSLGAKDYVRPTEQATAAPSTEVTEEILTVKDVPEGVYDEKVLQDMVSLGIFPQSYASIGNNYITEDDIAIIFNGMGLYTEGGRKNVRLSKAKTYILSLLGYNNNAAELYKNKAAEASRELMNNMAIVRDEYVTVHDLARLMYNALDEEVLLWQQDSNSLSFTTSKDRTLATEVLNLGVIEGQVTDNSISAIDGESSVSGERIAINGQALEYESTLFERYNLLGRYVKAYYAYEKWGYNDFTILSLNPSEDEEVYTISADDFIEYENHKLSYDVDGQVKNKRIESDTNVVYNGTALGSYNNNTFDLDNGSIQLIQYKDNGFNTVIISEYEDFLIGAMDMEEKKAYSIVNYAHAQTDNVELNLSDENTAGIFASDGTEMTFEDLQKYDVLSVIRNDSFAMVIVSRDIEQYFEISSIRNDDDATTLIGSGGIIRMSNYCVESGMISDFKPGETINIYLNVFGDGVWITRSRNQSMFVACLAKAYVENIDECYISVFQSDGEAKVYKAAGEVRFTDENGDVSTVSSADLYEKLNGRCELITYTVDDDDQIRQLELAAKEFSLETPNSFKLLDDGILAYSIGELRMGNNVFFADDATVFSVADLYKTSRDEYTIINNLYNLKNSKNYKVKLYGETSDMISTYAIIYDDNTSIMPDADTTAAVITSIRQTVYEGEPCVNVTVNDGAMKEFYADVDVVNKAYTQFSFMSGAEKVTRKATEGDIIRYKTDPVTGKLETIVVLYSPESLSPTGSEGWMPGAENVLSNSGGNTNPYFFTSNFTNDTITLAENAHIKKVSNYGEIKITYGYVVRKQDKVVEYTTEDLTQKEPFGYKLGSGYYIDRFKINQNRFVSVNIDKKGNVTVPVEGFDENSIRTFEDVGKSCTAVLRIQNEYGNITYFINK